MLHYVFISSNVYNYKIPKITFFAIVEAKGGIYGEIKSYCKTNYNVAVLTGNLYCNHFYLRIRNER